MFEWQGEVRVEEFHIPLEVGNEKAARRDNFVSPRGFIYNYLIKVV